MTDVLVNIEKLKISFFTYAGEVQAVRGISYKVKKGEVLGIVGESGSGKSVSSYSLLGMVPFPGKILEGKVEFAGQDLRALREKELENLRGKDISMIFQDPMTSLNPVYTIGKQIGETLHRHCPEMSREKRKERSLELLQLVGINQAEKRLKQYPHELSGGMRQRVMISMALCLNPQLLIADEPTTALDVTIQAQILELLRELKEKTGMAIIFITHDLGVVSEICDRISVMYGGVIVESGSVDQIFYEAQHPYTWGLLKSIPSLSNETERLIPIPGSPIDLINPPKGCPFAPRCEHCMQCCLKRMPPELPVSEGHHVSCWLSMIRLSKERQGSLHG